MRRRIGVGLRYAVLIAFALMFLAPVIAMVSTSFTGNERVIQRDLDNIRVFWPSPLATTNYDEVVTGRVIGGAPFTRYLANTVLIVGSIVILGVFVNSMAAFALARLRFRGRGILVAVVVALIIIPFEGVAVPMLLMVNRFGWLNSFHVQIVPFIAHPFSIFLFYQFFTRLPKEFDEAAKVDGASWWQVYRKIVLPISLPVIATVVILQSLEYWTSFLWPLMVTRGADYAPLSVAMNHFFGTPPRRWGQIMAFASLTALPLLLVYLGFQRWFIQSAAQSGVKG